MSPTSTCIVAALYITACLLGIAGICLTTSIFLVRNKDGALFNEVHLAWFSKKVSDGPTPGRWGYVGPILIGASVIVGLFGNLIWLFISS